MSRGSIRRRGQQSWELKFDISADGKGKRQTRYVTIKGRRSDAEKELTRLLSAGDAGTLVEPSRTTVAEYLRMAWNASRRRSTGSASTCGAHAKDRRTLPRAGRGTDHPAPRHYHFAEAEAGQDCRMARVAAQVR